MVILQALGQLGERFVQAFSKRGIGVANLAQQSLRYRAKIRALMTPTQLARITTLDAGRRMARLAADAACADLLPAAFYPAEGVDTLTTGGRGGYFPPGCVDLFRFEYIMPEDRAL